MPNHFTTIGMCARDYDRLEDLVKDDPVEIDFSELTNKNLCDPNDKNHQCERITDNWGTKWGTYATRVHHLGGDCSPILIEFQSALGPPNPETMRKITEYLCDTYCLKNIKWIGHDPSDGTISDIEI